jgi:hypothetical protein
MKRTARFVVVLLAVASSACATSRSTISVVNYPVGGAVTAGPTCPVQQDPPGVACDDRPVAGARLLVLDSNGDVVADVVADSEGMFDMRVPAGAYVLEPQPNEGFMGTAQPVEFEVGSDLEVDLEVRYDTGIR